MGHSMSAGCCLCCGSLLWGCQWLTFAQAVLSADALRSSVDTGRLRVTKNWWWCWACWPGMVYALALIPGIAWSTSWCDANNDASHHSVWCGAHHLTLPNCVVLYCITSCMWDCIRKALILAHQRLDPDVVFAVLCGTRPESSAYTLRLLTFGRHRAVYTWNTQLVFSWCDRCGRQRPDLTFHCMLFLLPFCSAGLQALQFCTSFIPAIRVNCICKYELYVFAMSV